MAQIHSTLLLVHKNVRQHPALADFFSKTHPSFEEWHEIQQIAHSLQKTPEYNTIRAADLNAISLIYRFWHQVLAWYDTQAQQGILWQAAQFADKQMGRETVNSALKMMVKLYFSPKVYANQPDKYVAENRVELLKYLILLKLANENSAFAPLRDWFNDDDLRNKTAYTLVFDSLNIFFSHQAPLIRDKDTKPSVSTVHNLGDNLIEVLRESFKTHPSSLTEQLSFWQSHWGESLGQMIPHLLRGMDFIHEANRMPATFSDAPPPPPPVPVFRPSLHEMIGANHSQGDHTHAGTSVWVDEPEQFSEDLDWMPRVVMIAKSTLVWLAQLSKQYQRPITRLDEIPDEELDQLARRGFTALWFIGIWERSHASRLFKQKMGNPEAAASAYSLYNYDVAESLGGIEAFLRLKERAWKRGVRIACDMVPNHTGIDGKWVLENPDRFVQVSEPPYPSYSFTRENLSTDPHIGIYMEDHYYDHSDAAVVYKRVDFRTGDVRYLYHGNDGTGLPWNDTAQINFLNPEAKEAVIQIILHVARMFPIIRLDAAMVLAKQHIQRLWFPEPGKGGSVASRSLAAMSQKEFDRLMPEEFWREVVDRVADEVPDTLLLAEAFWMLEGYFVRSLGMHRVYNSAFMHMFRDERNDEYRQLIKNTLDFDPEILKRYVNFLNNPDEKTAVEQFGKGDKYFGTTIMMLTLPGLPMFGHGQIEGFSEKYGMEYTKAYYDEMPDVWLVERHEREVSPIMHKRYLFANVEHFRLYDFVDVYGKVNENVFAFTNQHIHERAFVLYNNRFERSTGYVKTATPFKNKAQNRLVTTLLYESLGSKIGKNRFTIFRNPLTQLEYIRSNQELAEKGFWIELNGYQYQIFTEIREVEDSLGFYRALCDDLHGHPIPNVEEAIKERQLFPLHTPFSALMNLLLYAKDEATNVEERTESTLEATHERIESVAENATERIAESVTKSVAESVAETPFSQAYNTFLLEAANRTGNGVDYVALTQEASLMLETIRQSTTKQAQSEDAAPENLTLSPNLPLWYGWLSVYNLGKLTSQNGKNIGHKSRGFIDAWMLDKALVKVYCGFGLDENTAYQNAALVAILTSHQDWFAAEDPSIALEFLFSDPLVSSFLHVHTHNNISYFNKERFELLMPYLCEVAARKAIDVSEFEKAQSTIQTWLERAKTVSYRRDALLEKDDS